MNHCQKCINGTRKEHFQNLKSIPLIFPTSCDSDKKCNMPYGLDPYDKYYIFLTENKKQCNKTF